MSKVIEKLKQKNLNRLAKDGPRLSYGYSTWIEAKDTKGGYVLLGGLGGMGVGSMWFPMGKEYEKYPGFKNAPEEKYNAPDFSTFISDGSQTSCCTASAKVSVKHAR